MALGRIVWGGNIYSSNTTNTGIIDEWSCSLSVIQASNTPASTLLGDLTAYITPAIRTFHTSTGNFVSQRCALEYVKYNTVDPVTGIQETDPTVEQLITSANRGAAGASSYATFLALKVSIDNGTRNRRTKGGFYIPVFSAATEVTGRYSSTVVGGVLTAADNMLEAIKVAPSVLEIGVWSRVAGSVTTANRVRVGDVPDFISRRKNAMTDAYTVSEIL